MSPSKRGSDRSTGKTTRKLLTALLKASEEQGTRVTIVVDHRWRARHTADYLWRFACHISGTTPRADGVTLVNGSVIEVLPYTERLDDELRARNSYVLYDLNLDT